MKTNELLHQLQASLTVFYANLKNFHWNLVDQNFLVIHKYTDKLAQKTNDFIDEVAEKIRALDEIAFASFAEIQQNAKLEFLQARVWNGFDVINEIAAQIKIILQICEKIQGKNISFAVTTILPLIDELIIFYHKELWKVNAQLPKS
ncbi:DNA starvation/stationary phase protection protein [Mycoplasma sp. 'Moose RK']|uniref:Dps family protein n=1 Tax=Mycoplasma sp. 'Moose RK' TaxID=2780095 RepID=UPI0018C2551A|nr:DNA starvation/stationary phase protection protein [Mycoplasma sp. 'Moose RK']MBG0730710.1 DNA starvation/stationary phase protection protein [Mycoplasma sp. 'Moose RK']